MILSRFPFNCVIICIKYLTLVDKPLFHVTSPLLGFKRKQRKRMFLWNEDSVFGFCEWGNCEINRVESSQIEFSTIRRFQGLDIRPRRERRWIAISVHKETFSLQNYSPRWYSSAQRVKCLLKNAMCVQFHAWQDVWRKKYADHHMLCKRRLWMNFISILNVFAMPKFYLCKKSDCVESRLSWISFKCL